MRMGGGAYSSGMFVETERRPVQRYIHNNAAIDQHTVYFQTTIHANSMLPKHASLCGSLAKTRKHRKEIHELKPFQSSTLRAAPIQAPQRHSQHPTRHAT